MEPHFNSGIRNIRSYAVKTGDKTKTGSEGFEPSTWRLGGVRAVHSALVSEEEAICATSPPSWVNYVRFKHSRASI